MQVTLLASLIACAGFVAAQTITAKATVLSDLEVRNCCSRAIAGRAGTDSNCSRRRRELIERSDIAVALPSSQFDRRVCSETITLTTRDGTQVRAVVTGECVGCARDTVGVTEAAYKALSPSSEGHIDVAYSVAEVNNA
ncbi:hypothetical protein C8F01DRAFT_1255864 [Mycena amicta]|nr:hypothetical protein C8F01DRAFT_1255864 [Mycena amicta]